MATLTRDDLVFDYSWTAIKGDNPRLTGEPDNALLNRHEGYEVLDFLNAFVDSLPTFKAGIGLVAERLIHEELPPNIRSRKDVRAWLLERLRTFV